MDGTVNFQFTQLQLIISLVFQIWIIAFPIILIRKINYLTDLLNEHLYGSEEEGSNQDKNPQ